MYADEFTTLIHQQWQVYSESFLLVVCINWIKIKNWQKTNHTCSHRTSFHHATLFSLYFLSLALCVWDKVGTAVPGRLRIRLELSALSRHTQEIASGSVTSHFILTRRRMVCWMVHTLWQFTLNLSLEFGVCRRDSSLHLFKFTLYHPSIHPYIHVHTYIKKNVLFIHSKMTVKSCTLLQYNCFK